MTTDDESNDQLELDVPIFIELKSSNHASNDLGAFCRMPMVADQFLGSFKGKIRKTMSLSGDQEYVWTILSSRQLPLFYIDATDPKDSNWLRFIRFTNDISKYNVICMQQNQQINYFTFKEIGLGEELVTYLPHKKKRNKNKNGQNSQNHLNFMYKLVDDSSTAAIIKKEAKIPANKIEINILKDDRYKKCYKHGFFSLNFDLIINEKTKLKRRLIKCDLCPYVFIGINEYQDSAYVRNIKQHITDKHLAPSKYTQNKVETQNDDILSIIDEIIFKIENKFDYKACDCNATDSLFHNKKHLNEHMMANHQNILNCFSCLYCSETFNLNNLMLHLTNDHKANILNSLLLSEDLPSNQLLNFNWAENYFNHWIEIDNILQDESENEEEEEEEEDDVESSSDTTSSKEAIKSSKEVNKPNKEERIPNNKANKSSSTSKTNRTTIKKTDENGDNTETTTTTTTTVKTWTCQLCKKQFEQRIDLSKHQCIEINLKVLKKKKELRKKKWREAHWKRKIDLSYIETTNLTQLSQNIADNLSFCIDGTQEDLNAYSREVKDYLNTELSNQTHMQMFIKSCLPDLLNTTATGAKQQQQLIDSNLIIKKANSYFTDCVYQQATNSNQSSIFNCKNCRFKTHQMVEIIQHQRDVHNLDLKTSFDCYNNNNQENNQIMVNWLSSNRYANSPIGYFSCDPFAYLFNLYWDQTIEKKCDICNVNIKRGDWRKHAAECKQQQDATNFAEMSKKSSDDTTNFNQTDLDDNNTTYINSSIENHNGDLDLDDDDDEEDDLDNNGINDDNEQVIIIFEPRTGPKESSGDEQDKNNIIDDNTSSSTSSNASNNETNEICQEIMSKMIEIIENQQQISEQEVMPKQEEQESALEAKPKLKTTTRGRKRSANQSLLDEDEMNTSKRQVDKEDAASSTRKSTRSTTRSSMSSSNSEYQTEINTRKRRLSNQTTDSNDAPKTQSLRSSARINKSKLNLINEDQNRAKGSNNKTKKNQPSPKLNVSTRSSLNLNKNEKDDNKVNKATKSHSMTNLRSKNFKSQ